MAPRREEDMLIHNTPSGIGDASSPASRPTMFELPKDISFLDLQKPSLPSNGTNQCDIIHQRMSDSLIRAKKRANALLYRVQREDFKVKSPLVYEACRLALQAEMSRMLDQATLLLEDLKVQDSDVSKMTKNKRLSVALINVLQYLDTLESALTFSSRERLEEKLHSVLESMASKYSDDVVEGETLNVCVSSYKAPCLAFDFRTGSPCTRSIDDRGDEAGALPLEVVVKPIVEFTADELIQKSSPEAEAFCVKIEKCTHEERGYGARDGLVGEAMVKIHIAPLAESKTKKEVVWGLHDDVEKVRVREVRAIQQNAFPSKSRLNFDMYSSTVYGHSGVTLTLALETCQTMVDNDVPKIQIELVVEP